MTCLRLVRLPDLSNNLWQASEGQPFMDGREQGGLTLICT